MTLDDTGKFFGILLSILALLGYIVKLSYHVGQLTFQVNQLWRVIFQNAQVELVHRGLAKAESPIRIVSEGFDFIRPHLDQYLPIYDRVIQQTAGLPTQEIERRLFQTLGMSEAESIIKNICVPYHLDFGAGVMAVIQACQKEREGTAS